MFFDMFKPREFMSRLIELSKVDIHHFVANKQWSPLVNAEMESDSFFHPNLGGVTQGGMSNHYPMTIMSLAALGAKDGEISHFRQRWPRYRAHISKDLNLVDRQEITLDNWTTYLGKTSRLLEFQRVFLQGLLTLGKAEFINCALDKMKLSLPMGLYHPLIQLSFAAMHGDQKLIANALAYFAIRYQNLYREYPKLPLTSQSDVLVSSVWANAHQHIKSLKTSFEVRGGSLNICEQLCAEKSIQQIAFPDGFVINEENLTEKIAQISQAAIKLYLYEPALTTLHAVTSCQALADLTLRFTRNNTSNTTYVKIWSLYWIWLTSLYLEKGCAAALPSVDTNVDINAETDTDWHIIAQQACNIPEVHLIKMVYSCKWLYEHVQADELYRIAAMNIITEKDAHPSVIKWIKNEKLT